MLFNSLQYVVFLPVVIGLYFLLPHRFRWILLLISSYFFYMCWNVSYAALIAISTCVTFFSGLLIGRENRRLEQSEIGEKECKRNKHLYVALSFAINLGILAFFKYSPMAIRIVERVSSLLGKATDLPDFKFLLPVGISFYTFQALSYTMDVYRGKIAPSRNIGKYALFVSFFPQLVAGPIERSSHLLPQFDKVMKFDYTRARKAFLLILWGMFKKVVIADRIAPAVDQVFSRVTGNNGVTFIFAAFLFAIQIYCDFSAYTDIAIGSANIMGFDIMKNFKRPYFSKSISEFWRRWHISLSSWFRDYLYIPLGGSRVGKLRWAFNTMTVFVVSGLWHGASWGFVMWGALHGVYLLIGKLTRPVKDRILDKLKISRENKLLGFMSGLITFALVCFAWILFRARSMREALYVIKSLFTFKEYILSIDKTLSLMNMSTNDLALIFTSIIILAGVQIAQSNISIREAMEKTAWPIRWAVYLFLIFGIILLGYYGVGDSSFIYFSFRGANDKKRQKISYIHTRDTFYYGVCPDICLSGGPDL